MHVKNKIFINMYSKIIKESKIKAFLKGSPHATFWYQSIRIVIFEKNSNNIKKITKTFKIMCVGME